MDQMGGECCQELHVLAVDDSFVDRKIIERLLKISCCKVTVVENAKKALQYLGLDGEEKSPYEFSGLKVNLILSDYSMPGMTGYELLKKIKGSSAFSQVPVVLMSSENIVARIDRCLEEGAEDFLLKPVKLSDVKRIRDSILNFGAMENVKKQTCKGQRSDDLSSPARKLSPPLSSLNQTRKRKNCEDHSAPAQKLSVAIDTAA